MYDTLEYRCASLKGEGDESKVQRGYAILDISGNVVEESTTTYDTETGDFPEVRRRIYGPEMGEGSQEESEYVPQLEKGLEIVPTESEEDYNERRIRELEKIIHEEDEPMYKN